MYAIFWYEEEDKDRYFFVSRRKKIPEVGSVVALTVKGKKLKVKIIKVRDIELYEYLDGGLIEVIVEIQSGHKRT